MSEVNYITPAGLKRLLDERDHLLKVERPEITRVVAWAASNGDRSENADYQYGKRRLREIDRRLHFLKKRIEAAQVVDPALTRAEKVQFGAQVEVMDEHGQQRSYTIVGVDEIDTEKGLISWKSPVGSALLGKEVGDEVTIQTPKGKLLMEIQHILFAEIKL